MSMPNDPHGQGPYGGYDPYVGPPSYPSGTPSYPSSYPGMQPYPGHPAPPGPVEDPDSAMGIVGLVLSVVSCGPIGLVVSWMALSRSKQRGFKNTPALIGAILGAVFTLLVIVPIVIFLVYLAVVAIAIGSSNYLMLL